MALSCILEKRSQRRTTLISTTIHLYSYQGSDLQMDFFQKLKWFYRYIIQEIWNLTNYILALLLYYCMNCKACREQIPIATRKFSTDCSFKWLLSMAILSNIYIHKGVCWKKQRCSFWLIQKYRKKNIYKVLWTLLCLIGNMNTKTFLAYILN